MLLQVLRVRVPRATHLWQVSTWQATSATRGNFYQATKRNDTKPHGRAAMLPPDRTPPKMAISELCTRKPPPDTCFVHKTPCLGREFEQKLVGACPSPLQCQFSDPSKLSSHSTAAAQHWRDQIPSTRATSDSSALGPFHTARNPGWKRPVFPRFAASSMNRGKG